MYTLIKSLETQLKEIKEEIADWKKPQTTAQPTTTAAPSTAAPTTAAPTTAATTTAATTTEG